jgi:hypothetical protein
LGCGKRASLEEKENLRQKQISGWPDFRERLRQVAETQKRLTDGQ